MFERFELSFPIQFMNALTQMNDFFRLARINLGRFFVTKVQKQHCALHDGYKTGMRQK